MIAGSNLERVLEEGKFAVTAELGPPKGTNRANLEKKAVAMKAYCDAVNVTDNQTAIVRMCSLSVCIMLQQLGIEPVLQMTCRDRNRIAIQSDILGAAAFGIKNVLALSGDHQSFGNHPAAKNVFDIDSIQLVQALVRMRDEKRFICGENISGEVPLFIGAAANPYADPFEFRVIRMGKKIRAGASFIQTQPIFDVPKFARFMQMARERGYTERAHILAGIIPMKGARMARYMAESVPGVSVPTDLVARMEQAADAKEEGIKIAVEIIEEVKKIDGVHGMHLMAVGWEEIVPVIVEKAGLLPRPVFPVAEPAAAQAAS